MSLIGVYGGLLRLLTPAVHWHLRRRRAAGKEDPARMAERLGRAALPRPAGPLVWVHAASVGESLSVLPLIGRLRAARPDLAVLVTSGTRTSAGLLQERLPPGALHQYVPVDLPQAAERFLLHWAPDLVLWVESELWPSLIEAIGRRRLPLVLINGRMSYRSFRRWRWLRPAIARILGHFTLCLAQTTLDAARLRALGAPRVACPGNIKFSSPPLSADPAALKATAALLAGRTRWLAASTHPGEEALVGEVHRRVAAAAPGLLTLLVPRHPERGAEVAMMLRAQGLAVARRAAGEAPDAATEIYLADTLGELGLWYRLVEVAFVGGSLVRTGGHNPLEPARLDCAVLYGPYMSNFQPMARDMRRAGASRRVADAGELAAAVEDLLLGDAAVRRAMQNAALQFAESQAAALDRVLAAIEPVLPRAAAE